MNRGRGIRAICALAAALFCTPALAKDQSKPELSIEPIVAQSLLAPVEDVKSAGSSYRLDPGLDPSDGQRAKLSFDLGKATMFAITGRLQRQSALSGPLAVQDARTLGERRDSGKVYGAGVSTTFQGVDLSATYQFSKIRTEQGDTESLAGGPGRSHSLRATARLRFRH